MVQRTQEINHSRLSLLLFLSFFLSQYFLDRISFLSQTRRDERMPQQPQSDIDQIIQRARVTDHHLNSPDRLNHLLLLSLLANES